MTTGIDIKHLSTWIGRTVTATDIVTSGLVDRYRAVFAPFLYESDEVTAPPGLHWCLAPPADGMADLGPDGHAAKGGFLPPVPLPRRMWAGGEVRTLDVLRIGDTVTRTSEIVDVRHKTGNSGALCFVAVEHRFDTSRGPAIVERQDLVYRAPTPLAAKSGSEGTEDSTSAWSAPEDSWRVATSSTLLFRYSALTFNGHRIHYDLPYAVEEEGYDGLVVHGPLQATLLFNHCARRRGRTPDHFSYRGIAPLIAGTDVVVAAEADGEGLTCATYGGGAGRLSMQGKATW